MIDVGAVATAASAALVGALSFAQSRRSDLRSDYRELRGQQRLLAGAYADLWQWARKVPPDTAAGPPPEPPAGLDPVPW